MAFIPVSDDWVGGKRCLAVRYQSYDVISHQAMEPHLDPVKTRRRIFPDAFRGSPELPLFRGRQHHFKNDFPGPRDPSKLPWRDPTKMYVAYEYDPFDRKLDHEASVMSGKKNIFSPLNADPPTKARPRIRLAPIRLSPPGECEVPGFKGMGNQVLLVPNERPNLAAMFRTSAENRETLKFFGERKSREYASVLHGHPGAPRE